MPFFAETKYAKKLAGTLSKTATGFDLSISRSRSLLIVANWFGYETWEQYQASPKRDLSPLDFQVDSEERKMRRDHFVDVLIRNGIDRKPAETLVDNIRPSGSVTRTEAAAPHVSATSRNIVKLIASAYERNDLKEAAGLFASLLVSGSEIPAGLMEVLEKFSKNDPRALHHMAILLVSGEKAKDPDKAKRLLREQLVSFPKDSARSWVISFLADITNGMYGGEKSTREALGLYVSAAELGSGPAAMSAAVIYERHPELKDKIEAERLYRIAIDFGMKEAKTNLALMKAKTSSALPEKAEIAEIFSLLLQAASEGDAIAASLIRAADGLDEHPTHSKEPFQRKSRKRSRSGLNWREVLTKTDKMWFAPEETVKQKRDLIDGEIEDHLNREKRGSASFDYDGRTLSSPLMVSHNMSEYREATLHDVVAVLIDQDETIGVLNGSIIVRKLKRMSESDLVNVCDCASDEDAQLAMLLFENHTLDDLLGNKRTVLFVHEWEISRKVAGRGLGLKFLEALTESIQTLYGELGSVVVGVAPSQFEAYGIEDEKQYLSASMSLRNYIVQAGVPSGTINGVQLIPQLIPNGGMSAGELMFGLTSHFND